MQHRFKHYSRNLGTRTMVINLIVVAYLGYVFFRNGIDLVGIVLGGSVLIGALLPRLFLSKMVDHPGRTVRLMRIGQIAVIGLVVVSILNIWQAPPLVWIFSCLTLGLLLGMSFWLFSDPRILTEQGSAYYTAYADGYDPPQHEHHDPRSASEGLPPLVR